jgi:predicted signal transduction protein with EAL and GGDEF domain
MVESPGYFNLIAVLVAGLYWAFEYDIFRNPDGVSLRQHTIELDEALLLGAIMTLGLLLFSIRLYMDQRRETARRLAAEQHVRTLAFQDALTGLANRRQFNDALRARRRRPSRGRRACSHPHGPERIQAGE